MRPHDETDPLLNRAPRRSAPTEARSWISRISHHVSTWSTLYLCGLLVFLVDYPNFMGDAAKVRMLELGLCRDHYRVHDPSLIGDDGSVPEELCKLKGVQSSLARMRGYLQMLQYLIGTNDPLGLSGVARMDFLPSFYLSLYRYTFKPLIMRPWCLTLAISNNTRHSVWRPG